MSRAIRLALLCAIAPGVLSCVRTLGLASDLMAQQLEHDLQKGLVNVARNAEARQQQSKRCDELSNIPISLQEEVAFGGAMAVGLTKRGNGLLIDTDHSLDQLRQNKDAVRLADTPVNQLNRYLNLVGKNLAAQSSRPGLEWTFGVIDSDAVNAFSTPGGYVMVTRGLLRQIESEAQLAGVLAHEIAHITGGHAIDAYRRIKVAECRRAVLGEVGKDFLGPMVQSFNAVVDPGNGNGFIDLDDAKNIEVLRQMTDGVIDFIVSQGFGREHELGADREGLALVLSAGYQPREYIAFLGKLPEAKEAFPNHPPKGERQSALQQWLESQKDSALAGADYPFTKYAVLPLENELAAAR